MKKYFIKILSAALIAVMLLCLSGCTKNSVVAPYQYNPDLQTNNMESTTLCENDKFALKWDQDKKAVLLLDKADGYVWSHIPEGGEEDRFDEYGDVMEKEQRMLSALTVDYIDTSTYAVKTAFGSEALENGNFSVRATETGLKITYMFPEVQISVPVEYILCEEGLKVTVDPKNIAEANDGYFLHTVSIAPFMCSAPNMTEDAYLFYPSGSGALIYMDEQEDISRKYFSDVYGRDRMTDIKTWAEESDEENVRMPVYGSKFGNRGMLAVVESGAESCTIATDVYNKKIGYSAIYTEYAVRGEQNVSNQFLTNSENSMKYSDVFAQVPYTVMFYPLKDETASYTGMAKIYRDYLIKSAGLSVNEENTELAVKILGGSMIDSSVLGVPSRKFFAATSTDEAQDIIEEIKNLTGAKISATLVGYGKTGMEISQVAGGFAVSSKLGGTKGLESLLAYSKDAGVQLSVDFDILGISKSGNGYSKTFDVAVANTKQRFNEVKYALATNNNRGKLCWYISRSLIGEVATKLLDKVNQWQLEAVAFDTLSNLAYSDYNYQEYYSKSNMGSDAAAVITQYRQAGKAVIANSANAYAASVASMVVDAPVQSSRHDLFSVDIPFYEMVFRGYVPMYSNSLNLTNDEQDLILRSVESGNRLSFTVMKNFTGELRSEFDYFHALSYDDLKEGIAAAYHSTKDYFSAIEGCEITEHTLISETLRKTTFSNGVSVYVNFGRTAQSTPLGTVEPDSYIYGQEGR